MDDFEFLVDPRADAYMQAHTSPLNALLNELDRETHVKVLDPRMISGSYQGLFLQMLSRMIKPHKILEIGSFTGYSALCLCEGLQEGGKLISIEHDKMLEDILEKYIERSGKSDQIELIFGEAKNVLERITDDSFDLIFLDADKEHYSLYYPMLKAKLKAGGWMIVDNVLWNGKVWDQNCNDKVTNLIRKFNDEVQSDTEVENITLFLRDGFMIIRKKETL